MSWWLNFWAVPYECLVHLTLVITQPQGLYPQRRKQVMKCWPGYLPQLLSYCVGPFHVSAWLCHSSQMKGNFWIGLAFELVDSVKQVTFLNVGKHHPTLLLVWGEKKQKKEFTLFSSYLDDQTGTSIFCPWTDIDTIAALVLRPLDLDQNYSAGSPGSPGCKGQNIGLLSLCKCISQFLIINFHLYVLYIKYVHVYYLYYFII